MGDLRAAVAVGGGLGVGVDLDGLELLGNPRSCRERERVAGVRAVKPEVDAAAVKYRQLIPRVG